MINRATKKRLKEKIRVSKEIIENKLKSWNSIKETRKEDEPILEIDNWGNRILGNIQSLEFCLKEINKILNIDMLKE